MRQQSVRSLSASPEEKVIPPPTPDNQPKHYPEHIKSIVDQIAGLTLIEVADLNQLLKVSCIAKNLVELKTCGRSPKCNFRNSGWRTYKY